MTHPRHIHAPSLPPGSCISAQQLPTSPPLHSQIQTAHAHIRTCEGLYAEIGILLEHGVHYHHNTTHAGSAMKGGDGDEDGVVSLVAMMNCNSIIINCNICNLVMYTDMLLYVTDNYTCG